MNDLQQEHNWVLEQANEIAIEVARRLPPFVEGYSDFMFAINSYIHAGKSICAKFMAISACVFRFENQYKDIEDNLWLKPLREEFAKISTEDKQILSKMSIDSPSEKLEKICSNFIAWMDALVTSSKDFMPIKLDPVYKHNTNNKLANMDANFMDREEVLLAGSEHVTDFGGENFLKVLNKSKVKIVVAAAKGNEDDGFGPYWPSSESEEMAIAGLSTDIQILQIDIKNGGCLNFDWDSLLKMEEVVKTYAESKKTARASNKSYFFEKELERIFVHCAMGRGRTGSFNSLLVLLEKNYFFNSESAKLFQNAMNKLSANKQFNNEEKMLLVNELVSVINFLRKQRGHAIEHFWQLLFVVYNQILMAVVLSDQNEESSTKNKIENLRNLLNMNNDKFPVTKVTRYTISKDIKLHLIEDLIHIVNYYKHFSEITLKLASLIPKLENFKKSSIGDEKIGLFITDLLKDVDKIRKQNPSLISNNLVGMEFKKCCRELNAWSGAMKNNINFHGNASTPNSFTP